jgi:hypothetical protein
VGVITSLDPFQVKLNDEPRFSPHAEVLLIAHAENRIAQAKGHIERVVQASEHKHLEISHGGWIEEDRRQHERFTVDLPGRIQAIRESGNELITTEFEGWFKDVSLSGGWIASDHVEPRGSLVRWQMRFDHASHPISGLALVARACPKRGGMGLEFVEFFDGTRELLRVKLRSLG